MKDNLQHLRMTGVYFKNKIFPKTTYSQHHEDLVTQMLLGKVNRFIDIGANNGISVSNSFLFALNGASGLCFEPVPEIYRSLKNLYAFNNKVKCINEGLSDCDKKMNIRVEGLLSFIPETQDPWGEKNLKRFMSGQESIEEIFVRPLNYWLARHSEFKDCDVLSLDVEGHELEVLKGIDFTEFKAKIFIIEMIDNAHHKSREINSYLADRGYVPFLKNKLNTFFHALDKPGFNNLQDILINFPEYDVFP